MYLPFPTWEILGIHQLNIKLLFEANSDNYKVCYLKLSFSAEEDIQGIKTYK